MRRDTGSRWAAPAVITTATLWGTTGVAAALIPQENPVAIGTASVGVGGLISAATSLSGVRDIYRAPGAGRYVLLGTLGLLLYIPLFYVSVALTGAALGTIISIGSGPLFAGVQEWVLDGKRVTLKWLVSVLATVAGAGLLLAARTPAGAEAADGSAGLFPGVAAGLVAGITYALYAFAVGRLIGPAAARPYGLPHGAAVASIQGTAAFPMLALLFLTGEETFSVPVWPILLYLAVVPTALGHRFFAYGLGRMKASTATLYTVLEPVVATVLAVFLLGEGFSPIGWVGFPLVIAGLVLVGVPARGDKRAPDREQQALRESEAVP